MVSWNMTKQSKMARWNMNRGLEEFPSPDALWLRYTQQTGMAAEVVKHLWCR